MGRTLHANAGWLLLVGVAFLTLVQPTRGPGCACCHSDRSERAGRAAAAVRRLARRSSSTRRDDKGFTTTLIEETLAGLEPLRRVIQSDRSPGRAEPRVSTATSRRRLTTADDHAAARSCCAQHERCSTASRREFDVQRRFLVAIWGMETRYGRITGRDAGLPGAGDARLGTAPRRLLPRRAVRRADDGAARAHRGARR